MAGTEQEVRTPVSPDFFKVDSTRLRGLPRYAWTRPWPSRSPFSLARAVPLRFNSRAPHQAGDLHPHLRRRSYDGHLR